MWFLGEELSPPVKYYAYEIMFSCGLFNPPNVLQTCFLSLPLCHSPSLSLVKAPPLPCFFPASAVISDCILKSKDSELLSYANVAFQISIMLISLFNFY